MGKLAKGSWKKPVRKWYREWQLGQAYTQKLMDRYAEEQGPPRIILVLTNETQHGGLVDRLKGIVSCYAIACELGMRFSVYANNEQFDLFEYLIPSDASLVCKPDRFLRVKSLAKPIYLNDWMPKSRQELLRQFGGGYRQYHVFTNQDYTRFLQPDQIHAEALSRAWAQKFHALFSFSQKVKKEAGHCLPPEASPVAIHARFLSGLGDFEDVVFKPLPEEKKKTLIANCLAAVERIAFAHPTDWILVVSDSSVFLKEVQELAEQKNFGDRLLADANHIGHIDFVHDKRVLLKTFLDFYLLCRSKNIYQLRMPHMYSSQFSRYASYIAGRELIVVSA
jgi:hypothetical protein